MRINAKRSRCAGFILACISKTKAENSSLLGVIAPFVETAPLVLVPILRILLKRGVHQISHGTTKTWVLIHPLLLDQNQKRLLPYQEAQYLHTMHHVLQHLTVL